MLHFNGNTKPKCGTLWGKLWWQQKGRFEPVVRRRVERSKVTFVTGEGYKELSMREVCPMLGAWD